MSALVGMVFGWSLGVAIVWKVSSLANPPDNARTAGQEANDA